MIAVSVIIPSLNAMKYIRECVESVLSQTLKDIEVLCVDAGSTDGTLEYLRGIAAKDARVRVLLSDKKSYGYQMNLGIDVAQGKYIGIVEADDVIPPEMYDELFQVAESQRVELVKTDFYRFRDTPGGRVYILQRLTEKKELYHRVIDISQEKEPFFFPVNTWNGIYQHDFLASHQIRHNESSGASFQDNGFLFQTFMYAKRAYFLDKPYYMNRRDNEGSSVFNPHKVFSMAEEYRFIEGLLRKDCLLFSSFQFVFTYACFVNYMWTLKRVPYASKLPFLSRFRSDFLRFFNEKMMDTSMYFDSQLAFLFRLVYDEELCFQTYIWPDKEFYRGLDAKLKIIVYGAGEIGRAFMDKLCNYVTPSQVLSFAVTDMDRNFESYHGMPVRAIDMMLDCRESVMVVVAVGHKYHDEVAGYLKRLGFCHIVDLPISL